MAGPVLSRFGVAVDGMPMRLAGSDCGNGAGAASAEKKTKPEYKNQ